MEKSKQKIINDFNQALVELDSVLAELPEKGYDWAEKDGEWSIRQVVHHLAEDCNVYAFIIERGLATPGCKVFFGEFPGNMAWSNLMAWHERPVDGARELMHAHRKYLAEMVSHFPERWDNTVNFYKEENEKLAESSVEKMMIMLTEHMQEHVQMIRKIFEVHQG
jgi:hypothetical protein